MIKVSLDLLESNSQIYKKILNGILPEINKYMNNLIIKLKIDIPQIVETAIKSSIEYESILSGKLKYELGIPNPSEKLNGLLNTWINNIEFNYNKPVISSNNIKSSFSINMIRSDFSDVLSTDFSFVNDTQRNYSLPWLKWLVLDGTKTIVPEHEVIFGQNPASRTGFAIMSSSKKSWKVPTEYSGTESDNWITRAIDSVSPLIKQSIEKALI